MKELASRTIDLCRMNSALCVLSLSLLGSSGAMAENAPSRTEEIAVVLVGSNEAGLSVLRELAQQVDEDLTRQGVSHLSPERARALFEMRHSRAPVPLSAVDALIQEQVAHALEAMARGNKSQALRHLDAALERGAGAIESIHRDGRASSRYFHACLLSVQILLETGKDSAARARARECVVRSPGLTLPAEDRTYQPAVRALLAESHTVGVSGSVTVESTRAGCTVFVNGQSFGAPPYMHQSEAGIPISVQVECDPNDRSRARVHEVIPDEDGAQLRVDPDFEAAVRSDAQTLSLVSSEPAGATTRSSLRRLQTILGVPALIVATCSPEGRVALQRIGAGATASIVLAHPQDRESLHEALAVLIEPVRTEAARSATAAAADVPVRPAESRLGPATLGVAGSMLASGVALSALSFWRYSIQRDRAEKYIGTLPEDEPYYTRGAAWSDARALPYALGGVGSALSLTGSLWLGIAAKAERLPWWVAALSGSIGTGLASWGIAELARGGACGTERHPDTRVCADARDQRDLGALLVLSAAPALSTFVIKAVRSRSTERRTSQFLVSPRADGATFALRQPL